MRNKIGFFIAFVLLLAPLSASATTVQEVTTKTGYKIWLVEEHSVPVIAAKLVFTDAGSASDETGKLGRANMAAELLTEGADKMSAKEFHQALEDHAIAFGTDVDEDLFEVELRTLTENAQEAFRLMGLAVVHPTFAADDVERIRARLLNDIKRAEENVGYVAGRSWNEHAFAKHAYAQPSIGTVQDVKSLSAKDFKEYTQRSLTRDRVLIAVAGDITPAQVTQWFDEYLGDLPAVSKPYAGLQDVSAPLKSDTVIVHRDVPQSTIIFGMPGIKRSDVNFIPAYVMNFMLGGNSLTSRLGAELRDKRGLTYSAGTGLDSMLYSAVLQGDFATRNDQVETAVQVMKDTLTEAKKKGFTAAELEDAKQYLTGSFPLQLDSNGDVANLLITMQLYHLGKDYIDKRNDLMKAVTLEQVNDAAKKLINPDKLLTVVVGDPKGM